MSQTQSLDRRLLHYLTEHWKLLLAGGLCAVVMGSTALSLPLIAKYATNALIHKDSRLLLKICVGVVLVYILRWFLSWWQTVIFAEVSQRIGQRLRLNIYAHLQSLSLSYFDNQRTGNLLSTFFNDVPIVQNGIMQLKDAVSAPVIAVGGLVSILVISWQLSLITIAILPVMAWAMNIVSRQLRAISHETQNRLGDVTTITEETLSGARLVRAFGAEQREIDRFGRGVQAAKDITMSGNRRSAVLSPTTDLMGAIGLAAALWVGGHEVIKGDFSLGGLIAFVFMVDRIKLGVSTLGNLLATWKQTLGAAQRIFDNVLDVPSEVTDEPGATALQLGAGQVEFDDVSFGYRKDQMVLDRVKFTMRPGQVTAIVGPSGAGKSTLADLIPRFYDPTSGAVRVDGQDIKHVTIGSLRHGIGIVPQETTIFGGTVRENVSYGRPNASIEQVIDAAKAANAHDFILGLPQGYDTVVGERGVLLSGGQRQRIAIARALLFDPRILILDEATSSLDEQSQVLVQEALETLMEGRTTLVIAHRLSTIKNADQIVVLEAGRIIEQGSHLQLLRAGGAYKRLYETQFRNSDIESLEAIGSPATAAPVAA